jgi:hypothetical protein
MHEPFSWAARTSGSDDDPRLVVALLLCGALSAAAAIAALLLGIQELTHRGKSLLGVVGTVVPIVVLVFLLLVNFQCF